MYASLVLSAALVAPAAPLPRDASPDNAGPAPRVLALRADAAGAVRITGSIPVRVTVTQTHFVIETVIVNGQQVQQQVQKQVEQDITTSQYMNKALAEFDGKFTTADGTPLTVEEATARVKNGATVLASADGKPIARSWLRAVGSDTVVMVADGLSHVQPQAGGGTLPTTPAPRLAMLGTDAAGKLTAACTSNPITANNGIYYDDIAFEGRAFRGGRMMRNIDYNGDYYPQQVGAKVVLKPLADVKFDAYDLTGKLVPRGEALKRLAAGGMVLVAGDARLPDEAYLKAFREDVLVLVGSELVLPVAPIDQTKKNEPAKDGKPMAVPAAPLPAPPALIRPAVQIKLAPAAGAVPAPQVAAPPVKVEVKIEKPAEKP